MKIHQFMNLHSVTDGSIIPTRYRRIKPNRVACAIVISGACVMILPALFSTVLHISGNDFNVAIKGFFAFVQRAASMSVSRSSASIGNWRVPRAHPVRRYHVGYQAGAIFA